MDYAIITAPAAPVRRKPRHTSEMTNQLLFGETVKILRMKNKWAKIRSLHDNYEGWLTMNMLVSIDDNTAKASSDFVTSDLLGNLKLNGANLWVPAGATLPAFAEGKGMIGELSYQVNGNYLNRVEQVPGSRLTQLVASWLNTPYMWGGRTPLGADCSGFVQVVYKMMGIDLPRDTWQQAQEGRPVKKLKEANAGDLIFFDDKEEIVHVGILLSQDQIVHCYGKVRIDSIDKKGIVNLETGKHTHRSEAIRRLW